MFSLCLLQQRKWLFSDGNDVLLLPVSTLKHTHSHTHTNRHTKCSDKWPPPLLPSVISAPPPSSSPPHIPVSCWFVFRPAVCSLLSSASLFSSSSHHFIHRRADWYKPDEYQVNRFSIFEEMSHLRLICWGDSDFII